MNNNKELFEKLKQKYKYFIDYVYSELEDLEELAKEYKIKDYELLRDTTMLVGINVASVVNSVLKNVEEKL